MKKMFVLALDAGHYLGTPGKRCMASLDPNETREWILNDRVTRYQEERARMYEGLLTIRVDDPTGRIESTLAERVALANAVEADLYLSNHHNAGMNGKRGGGCVAYCSKGSTRSPEWRDALYDAVIAAGGLKGNRTEPKARANWYVCVHTEMPAVLMEYGFMDCPDDVPVILTDEHAKICGYATIDAIAAMAGLKLKDTEDETLPREEPAEFRFKGIEDVPAFARSAIGSLMACDAISGTGEAKGLDLSYDMLRLLVIMVRYVNHIHALAPEQPEIHDDLEQIGGGEIVLPVEPPEPEQPI